MATAHTRANSDVVLLAGFLFALLVVVVVGASVLASRENASGAGPSNVEPASGDANQTGAYNVGPSADAEEEEEDLERLQILDQISKLQGKDTYDVDITRSTYAVAI